MSEPPNYRMVRIRRLLSELEYEVVRGMMEREIDEHLGYRFAVPRSRNIEGGVVLCEFRTRPMPAGSFNLDEHAPRLKVVK